MGQYYCSMTVKPVLNITTITITAESGGTKSLVGPQVDICKCNSWVAEKA